MAALGSQVGKVLSYEQQPPAQRASAPSGSRTEPILQGPELPLIPMIPTETVGRNVDRYA